jgi:hypothetical protein
MQNRVSAFIDSVIKGERKILLLPSKQTDLLAAAAEEEKIATKFHQISAFPLQKPTAQNLISLLTTQAHTSLSSTRRRLRIKQALGLKS